MVPNLNVFYEEVELIFWDSAQCQPKKVPDPKDSNKLIYPSTFIFNVKSTESKEALTFYSRHHIEKVKLVELSDGVAAQTGLIERVKNGEIICCEPKQQLGIDLGLGLIQYKGSCLGKIDPITKKKVPMVKCEAGDELYENERSATLQTSLASWKKTLEDADQTKKGAISKDEAVQGWFNDPNVGQKYMSKVELNIGNMDLSLEAQLASNTLIQNTALLPEGKSLLDVETEEEGRNKIRETKRIQFSGATGAYELTLDKAVASERTSEDCNQNIPLIGTAAKSVASVATGATIAGGAAFGAFIGAAQASFSATAAAATAGAAASGAAMGAGAVAGVVVGPVLALAAGELVISSAIAGCNFELDVGLDPGEIGLKWLTFGIGASTELSGGKHPYCRISLQNINTNK